MLLSWLPRPLLAQRLSEANFHKLGVLSADLHEHGARFVPPAGFTQRTLQGLYVRDEPEVLFGDSSRKLYSREDRTAFERVNERVREALARLYSNTYGLRVIHNDLHHENVTVFRGRLRPLAFEDTIWGYPVQDIAMTFFDLLDYTSPADTDYTVLRHAFQRGYETKAAWPEEHAGEIDTFIAERQLWRANYVVCHEPSHAVPFIASMASRFRTFLATGTFPR